MLCVSLACNPHPTVGLPWRPGLPMLPAFLLCRLVWLPVAGPILPALGPRATEGCAHLCSQTCARHLRTATPSRSIGHSVARCSGGWVTHPWTVWTSKIGLGLSLSSSWFSPVWVTSGACWRPSRRLLPLGCYGYGSRRLNPPQTSPWSVLGTSDRLVGYGAHRMAGRRWLSWFSWYFVPWSAVASNNRKRREETFPTFTIGITRQTGLDMILPCLSSYA